MLGTVCESQYRFLSNGQNDVSLFMILCTVVYCTVLVPGTGTACCCMYDTAAGTQSKFCDPQQLDDCITRTKKTSNLYSIRVDVYLGCLFSTSVF